MEVLSKSNAVYDICSVMAGPPCTGSFMVLKSRDAKLILISVAHEGVAIVNKILKHW
jgi:hypothetical protein